MAVVLAPTAYAAPASARAASEHPMEKPALVAASAGRQPVLTIGFLGALSGQGAGVGNDIADGVKLAVENYNRTRGADISGGVDRLSTTTTAAAASSTSPRTDPAVPSAPGPPVRLVKYDTASTPASAVRMAQRAIRDHVVGLVGPLSDAETSAADPVLDVGGIVNVTPSATEVSLSNRGWRYWHRVVADDGAQAGVTSSFIASTLLTTSVAVVNEATVTAQSLAQAVQGDLSTAGVNVAVSANVDEAGTYDSTVATEIAGSSASVVYFAGDATAAGSFLAQLRSVGDAAVFVTDGQADGPGLVRSAGAANAEGSFVVCACAGSGSSIGLARFALMFHSAFGVYPGPFAAEGFDAANTILSAIGAGNSTGITINSWLGHHSFTGVTGSVSFDQTGQMTGGGFWLDQVRNGLIQPQGPLVGP